MDFQKEAEHMANSLFCVDYGHEFTPRCDR